jgi:hypothetical protein
MKPFNKIKLWAEKVNFGPTIEKIDTANFYNEKVDLRLEEKVVVRNSLSFHILLSGFYLLLFLYFIFFVSSDNWFYYFLLSFFFLVFIYLLFCVFNRSPKMIIDQEGIYLKKKGKFLWCNIIETSILSETVSDSDSTNVSYYLLVQVKGETVKFDLMGLNHSFSEIGYVIELFKKSSKQS